MGWSFEVRLTLKAELSSRLFINGSGSREELGRSYKFVSCPKRGGEGAPGMGGAPATVPSPPSPSSLPSSLTSSFPIPPWGLQKSCPCCPCATFTLPGACCLLPPRFPTGGCGHIPGKGSPGLRHPWLPSHPLGAARPPRSPPWGPLALH